MPVILHNHSLAAPALAEAEVLARLIDAAGAPTLEGAWSPASWRASTSTNC